MPKQEASRARERGKTARDKQLQRAQDRQIKFGPQKTVTPSNVQNITLLESMTVSSTRRETYVQAWDTFTQFVKTSRLKIVTVEQLDGAAVWWIDHLYFQGENVACSHDLHGGSEVLQKRCVPHVRLEPGFQRFQEDSPEFLGLSDASSDSAAHPDPQAVCLWLLLTWHLCARPGEVFKPQWKHMVAPNPINRFWSAVMSPSSDEEGAAMPSKVGETDESVTLNVNFLQWMNPLLAHLKTAANDNDFVCPFPQSQGSKIFLEAVDALGFRSNGVQCTYQIRHGAASTEVLCRGKALEDVMKKGRWKTLVSVRRYEQGGKLAQVFESLSKKVQKQCLDSEALLAQQMLTFVGCRKRPKVVFSWKSSPAREI